MWVDSQPKMLPVSARRAGPTDRPAVSGIDGEVFMLNESGPTQWSIPID